MLDDRDVLWEGWGPCDLPPAFSIAVYRYRVERARRRINDAVDDFVAHCIDADPHVSDIAGQGCQNMRDHLNKMIDELRALS